MQFDANRGPRAIALSYFTYYGAVGILLPYLSPALIALNYSSRSIGLIQAGMAACTIFAPALGGRLCDRYFAADTVMRLCSFLALGVALLLCFMQAAPALMVGCLLLLLSCVRAPMVPLQDALAMQVADGQANAYSRLRLMGSVGFMVAAVVSGWLFADALMPRFFYALIAAFSLLAASSLLLPRYERRDARVDANQAAAFWARLDRRFWVWLSAMLLHWFAFGPYHFGLTLFLNELHFNTSWVGWVWSLGVLTEIIAFASAHAIFARLNHRVVLGIALVASLVRWLALGLWPTPPVVWATQLLHGPAFALFYAASMQEIRLQSDGQWQASYQGLFSALVTGLGSATGMAAAGFLHQAKPFSDIFLMMVVPQVMALLLLGWAFSTRGGKSHARPLASQEI